MSNGKKRRAVDSHRNDVWHARVDEGLTSTHRVARGDEGELERGAASRAVRTGLHEGRELLNLRCEGRTAVGRSSGVCGEWAAATAKDATAWVWRTRARLDTKGAAAAAALTPRVRGHVPPSQINFLLPTRLLPDVGASYQTHL